VIHTAKFPDTGICLKQILMFFYEIRQMNTADFFFSLKYEFDIAG